MLWRLDAYLDALVILKKTDPHGVAQHVSRLLLLLAACTALLTVSLAGVLSYMALQVLSSGQYPPPGMRVIRDTQLRTGSRATALAQVTAMAIDAVFAVNDRKDLWEVHCNPKLWEIVFLGIARYA